MVPPDPNGRPYPPITACAGDQIQFVWTAAEGRLHGLFKLFRRAGNCSTSWNSSQGTELQPPTKASNFTYVEAAPFWIASQVNDDCQQGQRINVFYSCPVTPSYNAAESDHNETAAAGDSGLPPDSGNVPALPNSSRTPAGQAGSFVAVVRHVALALALAWGGVKGVTLRQRWHRLAEAGRLTAIRADWEEWQGVDPLRALQGLQAGRGGGGGARGRRRRDERDVGWDPDDLAPRQARSRRAPQALQDFQVEPPAASISPASPGADGCAAGGDAATGGHWGSYSHVSAAAATATVDEDSCAAAKDDDDRDQQGRSTISLW
eukprot:gene11268-11418_t